MTVETKTFLDGTATRNTNLLSTAQAEDGTGWTKIGGAASLIAVGSRTAANSTPTPFNGWDQAASSAWAWANQIATTAGQSYTIGGAGTFGTTLLLLSVFIRVAAAGTTTFTLNVVATAGTAQLKTAIFTLDATDGKFKATTLTNGIKVVPNSEVYGNGWQRVQLAYQVAWDTQAGDTSVGTDTFDINLKCNNGGTLDIWGVHMEQRTAATPPDSTSFAVAAYATTLSLLPYLVGLCVVPRSGVAGPLYFAPARRRYHKALWQIKSTVSGSTFSLLQRVGPNAPWEIAQSTIFTDLNPDLTKTYALECYPEYRLAITNLFATGVQGAWLAT